MHKKYVIMFPLWLRDWLAAAAEYHGSPMSSLVKQATHEYLKRNFLKLGPAFVKAEFWPSGWPRSTPCNRCQKEHDPVEHALNTWEVIMEARDAYERS